MEGLIKMMNVKIQFSTRRRDPDRKCPDRFNAEFGPRSGEQTIPKAEVQFVRQIGQWHLSAKQRRSRGGYEAVK